MGLRMAAGWEKWVEDDARLPLALFFLGGEPLSIWVMLQLYRGRAPCAGRQVDLIFSASNTLWRSPAEIEPSGRKSGKRAGPFVFFLGSTLFFFVAADNDDFRPRRDAAASVEFRMIRLPPFSRCKTVIVMQNRLCECSSAPPFFFLSKTSAERQVSRVAKGI